jgi:hypothetical protein
VYWALEVDRLGAVLVVELGSIVDGPPVLHLARTIVIPDSIDRVLAQNGWAPGAWLTRTWGRVARVNIDPGRLA